MTFYLHLLLTEPDGTTGELISALNGSVGPMVVSLYPDRITHRPPNWPRLIDDIFSHETVICWW